MMLPRALESIETLFSCPTFQWTDEGSSSRICRPTIISWSPRWKARVVGILGLHRQKARRAHVAQIGMGVHDDFQGKGAGTALMEAALDTADNWLNLKRVELTVFTDNARAVHLYEKFGFVTEGTHRDYAFRDGEYVDAYFMARVKE